MEQTRPIWKSMVIGAVAGTIIMLLLSTVVAMLISKTVLPESSTAFSGIAVCLLSGLFSALIAGRLQKGKLLITCLGSAGIYLAVLLVLKAAFFGAWDRLSLPMILGLIVCGIAASFVPTGKRTYRKKR